MHQLHGKIANIPCDLQSEQALLGSCLSNDEAVVKAVEMLTPKDFYDRKSELIFGAVADLFEKGQPVDTITVLNNLKSKGQIDEAGVMRWLPVLKESKLELIRLLREKSTARIWTPGNPFLCSCGYRTGWRLDERPLCPACLFDLMHPGNPYIIDSLLEPRDRIICQGFTYNGVMMATTPESCRE